MTDESDRPESTFNPALDAELLRDALNRLVTNEETIIEILPQRKSSQRHVIKRYYQLTYDRDLILDLKNALRGDFRDIIKAIMTPLNEYVAHEIYRMINKDMKKIVGILCSYDNKTLKKIKIAYHQLYGKLLEVAVKHEAPEDHQMFIEDLVFRARDDEDVSIPGLPGRVAIQLHDAVGEGRTKTDKDELRRIFTAYSYETLLKIFDKFYELANKPLDEALQEHLSGDFLKVLLDTYYCISNPGFFFAHELYSSMVGLGTRDHCLIRNVVLRCEVDIEDIKIEYKKIFGRSLKTDIKGDTSGAYMRVLLALIKA